MPSLQTLEGKEGWFWTPPPVTTEASSCQNYSPSKCQVYLFLKCAHCSSLKYKMFIFFVGKKFQTFPCQLNCFFLIKILPLKINTHLNYQTIH